jgi:hypothetical protein
MMDYSKFQCRYLKQSEIKAIADEFKKKYWPKEVMPIDMEYIIENGLGLNIIPIHGVRKENKIDAYLCSNLKSIVVDYAQYMDPQNRYANRLRFSFAHEIGHLVLHKNLYKEFDIESPDEYEEFVINFPDYEYESFEWQANEFAGSLLVPRKILVGEVERIYEILMEKKLLYMLEENPDQVLAGVSRVSPSIRKTFGVSDEVIERRVRVEKLWPPKSIQG